MRALLRLLLDGGHECQVGAWVVAAARRMDAGRTVGALLQSARSSSLQTTMMRTIGALEAVNKPGALPGPVGQAAVAAARALDIIAPGA